MATLATKADPKHQVVSAKDENNISNVYTAIEKKQYKRGIQLADAILKIYPTNGEMVAAKGMCMAASAPRGQEAQREAGVKLLKQGLMFNLKSTRTWLIQGLYYRNIKNFPEALKSYTQIQKLVVAEGKQPAAEILRDLAFAQAQCGKWDEYLDTRRQLISSSNQPHVQWCGFAVGCHLAGRPNIALEALNSYQTMSRAGAQIGSGKVVANNKDSELCLYRVEILYQQGRYEDALASLVENKDYIIDLLSYQLFQVRLLILLKKFDEAKVIILETILPANTDQLEAILLFFKASEVSLDGVQISDAEVYTKVNGVFKQLLELFPKSSSIIKLSLQYFNPQDAQSPLVNYIRPALAKGVPSLFKTLKSLYVNAEIAKVVENQMLEAVTSLTATNTFPNDTKQQTPTTLLSTYVYLAQHYDYFGNVEKAFEYLDLAEKHTPTFIDLYVYRAKVYKHAGNHKVAYYWIDFARSLDQADRWLNNKCSVYAYQAGLDDHGERTIGTFIKESFGVHLYQYNQQASWWFYQSGLCYLNTSKQYGMAVKYLASVDEFFSQYGESLSDYHHYCLRESTLRAYTGMITYLNAIKTHKFYLKAILPLIYGLLSMQYQVIFERSAAGFETLQDQVDYATIAKPEVLKAQQQALEDHYSARPGHQWRQKFLVDRIKQRSTGTDEKQSDDIDRENSLYGIQAPHYDIYGAEYFTNTFGATKFAKNDYSAFAAEANKFITTALGHFKGAHQHSNQSNVNSEKQNNSYLDCPPALLLLGLQTQTILARPLRALQQLRQATTLITKFQDEVKQYNSGVISTTTADQLLKRHFNGVYPWFQIKSSTPAVKLTMLPTYYTAQLFVSRMMVSALCSDESLATSNMNKNEAVIAAYKKQYQEALDKNELVPDVVKAIDAKVQEVAAGNQLSPCVKIITLLGCYLAAYYTKSHTVNWDTLRNTFDAVIAAIPADFPSMALLRAPLQSSLYVSNLLVGKTYLSTLTNSIPLITGLVETIAPQQCTFMTTPEAQARIKNIHSTATKFGAKHFPNAEAFMGPDQIQDFAEQFPTPQGPDFIIPPEKD